MVCVGEQCGGLRAQPPDLSGCSGSLPTFLTGSRAPGRSLRGVGSDGFRGSAGCCPCPNTPLKLQIGTRSCKSLCQHQAAHGGQAGGQPRGATGVGGHREDMLCLAGLTNHPRVAPCCHPASVASLSPTPPGAAAGRGSRGSVPGQLPLPVPVLPPRPGLSPVLPSVHQQRGGTWYPFIYKQITVK